MFPTRTRLLAAAAIPLTALAVQVSATSTASAAATTTQSLSPAALVSPFATGLTLTNTWPSWTVRGTGLAQGRADVRLWIVDTTGGGWSTHEYQAGQTTTSFFCGLQFCGLGGRLTAKGATRWIPPGGLFGGYWEAVHPLQCGHSYRPVSYDPIDGYVYGSTLTMGDCPIIH